jgi:kumamolisin
MRARADAAGAARVSFPRTVHPAALQSTVLRAMEPNRQLAFSVCLDWSDRAGAEAYADAVNDPASPLFRSWLTPEEVADRFGPSPAVYARVAEFLRVNGFTITNTYRHRLAIRATGSASRVEAVFHTQMRWLRESMGLRNRRAGPFAPLRIFYANVTPVQLPADIAPHVVSVVGLQNYVRPLRRAKAAHSMRRSLAGNYTPGETRQAYDAYPIYNAGLEGQGRTVAVSNWDGFDLTNTSSYISYFDLPVPTGGATANIQVIDVPAGSGGSGTDGSGEGDLDDQMEIGAAPLATILIYDGGADTGDQLYDVLAQEVSDDTADIISESYGWEISDASTYHDEHLTMTMQGQTYLVASGDLGKKFEPEWYPDGESEVLVIGGTMLTTDNSGNWSSEIAWSLGDGPSRKDASTGGTTTDDPPYTDKPSWQVGRGVPASDTGRDFPDISAVAWGSPNGAVDLYYQYSLTEEGGTSAASPLTAGLLALVEQQMIHDGYLPADSNGHQRLGRLAQALYGFNGRSDVFHDITSGNNGYSCTKYWDYVTGWGSVDMYNLAAALENPLAVSVSPQGPTIQYGQTQQCTGNVTGSNVKTVTWSLQSGPGSVNSSTGLYTAPATGTTTQQAVVVATSTIDTAAPVTGSTTITIVPASFNVSGTISMTGCENLAQSITFTLRPASGSTTTDSVVLSATGAYTLTGVPNGTYTIHVKGAKWLARNVAGVVVNNGAVSGVNATLLPGDINNDNVVDLNDFALLAQAFGSSSSSANWNANADLNCDGVVDLNDFSLLAEDFGLAGDS